MASVDGLFRKGRDPHLRVITQGPQKAGTSPSVSGDGRKVAWVDRGISNQDDVFVYDSDTKVAKPLVNDERGMVWAAEPCLARNGKAVAFQYSGFSGQSQVAVTDVDDGKVEVVSAGPGIDSSKSARHPSMSADGRFVCFDAASFEQLGSGSPRQDVYIHDRQSGTEERVSRAVDGSAPNGHSSWPSISGDGRFVAFDSNATNLVEGDRGFPCGIFVRDRTRGTTERVSVSSDGTPADGVCMLPVISDDGRCVAFWSTAGNLTADADLPQTYDIFVRDRQSGQTRRITPPGLPSSDPGCSRLSMSADGRYIAFASKSPQLVANDDNGESDIFVCDTQSGLTSRVSVGAGGTELQGASTQPAMSADGRCVVFETEYQDRSVPAPPQIGIARNVLHESVLRDVLADLAPPESTPQNTVVREGEFVVIGGLRVPVRRAPATEVRSVGLVPTRG